MSVVIETTLGDITVDLYLEQRPVTCLNFLKLCKMKYYNFNLFHSIRSGFIAQAGDPTAEGSGGESIFGRLEGPEKRFFMGEKLPKIRHTNTGTLSMVCTGDMMVGSQFFFTLAPDLDSLDGVHCVIGEVTEGHDVLRKLNDVICDESHRPYRDVRITHTVVLEDPFNDPHGFRAPSRSPSPSAERLKGGRIAPDEDIDETQGKTAQEVQELIEEKEAKARATILEIVGDLPDADIAPPENVLFVCKLNPVTTDEDLEIIFSRFGKIVGCEVIRDKKTGDSLQYAFVEFADKKSCEDAYFKMDNVLIDDRRIHVDFSQSVSKMRWFGKGRGVKYFNDSEAMNKTLSNDSSQHHKQNGDNHENGKIDDNKRRHRSKDRDHHKSEKHDKNSRNKSDRDRRDRSRSKSRKEKSSHRSKREKSRSVSRDTHRKRLSRTRSGERSKRRSRSRDRSRRDRDRNRSGHKSYRDRSRSRHRSNRNRSRSKHRSRRDRSTSRYRRDNSRSRHGQSTSSTRKIKSHDEKSKRDKERSSRNKRSKTKDKSPTKSRDRSSSISKENQSKLEEQSLDKLEECQKTNNSANKSQSVSPKNDKDNEENKLMEKYFLVKKSRWVEVTDKVNEPHQKEPDIASHENNDDKIIDNSESSIKQNNEIPGIEKENNKILNENKEISEQVIEDKKQIQIEREIHPTKSDTNIKSVEKDTRTPTPVIKKKDIKSKISKNDKKKKELKYKNKKKRKHSTSSDSSSSSSSSESSSSSDDDDKKKKSLKRRKKRVSTSSSSSSSESSSSSSSDSSSSSSSDSEPVKKKRKKKAHSKVTKTKKTKKSS